MFEIVKMTHICQYWRSTLISCPHVWSSIFVKNDHKDFVAACLKRSQEIPLTVCLDLKYGDYHDYPNCTCIRNEWSPGMRIDESNPCRYHTTIDPLLTVDHLRRIRKLDVCLDLLDASDEWEPDQDFKDALDNFNFFASPLPLLESLSFSVGHEFEIDTHLSLPGDFFCWSLLPPTRLRHLTLHGCYGGPIRAVHNLTSFELTGADEGSDPLELNQRSFLPFISGSPSLVSLTLSHCSFPGPDESSRVTPVRLSKLKTLRLTNIYGASGLPGLLEIPALKTLSSIHISMQNQEFQFYSHAIYFELLAENNDGFRLFYDSPDDDDDLVSDWLDITHKADPNPTFVRFEEQGFNCREGHETEVSPLPLFVDAKVLEIGAPFAGLWYRTFWKEAENIGPQPTTLRLEAIEEITPVVAPLVTKFVEARLKKACR